MKKGKRRWLKRAALVVLAMTGLAIVLGEIAARVVLGLGDPPLSVADEAMEYRFKPGDYRRFGNRVYYNAHSMRSDEAAPRKTRADEFRVLVLGDSVVNGGAQLDQKRIATELLKSRLAEQLQRPVWVGNASAGSWGPANLLAYVRRYGWFDADVVLIVVSSHDAADAPTFEPLVGVDPSFPDRKPALAITEAVTRYLPRYVPSGRRASPATAPSLAAESPAVKSSLSALGTLLEAAVATGARVLVLQHWEQEETAGGPKRGHDWIAAAVDAKGVSRREFKAGTGDDRSGYQDNVHLSAKGQGLLAAAMEQAIMDEADIVRIDSPLAKGAR